MTHSACGTAGCLLDYHHIVFVVPIFQFHMHLVALTVPFPPSDIITFVILLLHHDVKVEPVLQPLTGEALRYRTAICEDNARVDIRFAGFWGT